MAPEVVESSLFTTDVVELIKNKRAAGRPKDLDDLAFLTTVLGSKQEE
jgi:hypothetical protein